PAGDAPRVGRGPFWAVGWRRAAGSAAGPPGPGGTRAGAFSGGGVRVPPLGLPPSPTGKGTAGCTRVTFTTRDRLGGGDTMNVPAKPKARPWARHEHRAE